MGSTTSYLAVDSTEDDVKWAAMHAEDLQRPSVVAAKVSQLVSKGALTSSAMRRVNPPNKGRIAHASALETQKWLQLRRVLLAAREPTAAATLQLQKRLKGWLSETERVVGSVMSEDTVQFNTLLAQRQVVLERIFQARRHQLAASTAAGANTTPAAGSKSQLYTTGGLAPGVEAMLLMSIRMQLLSMSANPSLAPALAQMLETTVTSLRDGSGPMPAVVAEGAHAITTWFAEQLTAGGMDPAAVTACVGAMVRLGVASGSLRALLAVVSVLLGPLASVDAVTRSESIAASFQELAKRDGDFTLAPPVTMARTDALPSTVINQACQSSSIATDGAFFYLFTGTDLFKVGTGRDSVAGRVYLRAAGFHAGETGGMVVVGDRLFWRSASCAPGAIVTVDTATLEMVEGAPDAPFPALAASEASDPLFMTEGRYLYSVSKADNGGVEVLVADPASVSHGKMELVKTIALPARVAVFLEDPTHGYCNGQRLVLFHRTSALVVRLDTLDVEEVSTVRCVCVCVCACVCVCVRACVCACACVAQPLSAVREFHQLKQTQRRQAEVRCDGG